MYEVREVYDLPDGGHESYPVGAAVKWGKLPDMFGVYRTFPSGRQALVAERDYLPNAEALRRDLTTAETLTDPGADYVAERERITTDPATPHWLADLIYRCDGLDPVDVAGALRVALDLFDLAVAEACSGEIWHAGSDARTLPAGQ